jgi:mRNA interferase MazF
MVVSAAGAIVLVPFPFSDLSQTKLRPALVLAVVGLGDAILCQITSQRYGDRRAIALANSDMSSGSLRVSSFVRPGKLFTANQGLMVREIGMLRPQPFAAIVDSVVAVIRSGVATP